jgi:hypothetical protein
MDLLKSAPNIKSSNIYGPEFKRWFKFWFFSLQQYKKNTYLIGPIKQSLNFNAYQGWPIIIFFSNPGQLQWIKAPSQPSIHELTKHHYKVCCFSRLWSLGDIKCIIDLEYLNFSCVYSHVNQGATALILNIFSTINQVHNLCVSPLSSFQSILVLYSLYSIGF